MRKGKKAMMVNIPLDLYWRWVETRQIKDGEITKRLLELVEADTYLSPEDKSMQELEGEIESQRDKVLTEQNKLVNMRLRLKELQEKYKSVQQMDLKDSLEQADLLKELRLNVD